MPILFSPSFTIYIANGSGGASVPSVTTAGTGYRELFGSGGAVMPAVETDGEGYKEAFGAGGAPMPAVTASGGDRLVFGGKVLVLGARPYDPLVCVDAVFDDTIELTAIWRKCS
jgi:hypothetical protein